MHCNVVMPSYNASAVINVAVKSQAYHIGQTALFSCQATGEPVPFIEWYYNGAKVNTTSFLKYSLSSPISPNYADSTLIVLNVTSMDTGTYTCNATNVVGSAVSKAQLRINGWHLFIFIYNKWDTCFS